MTVRVFVVEDLQSLRSVLLEVFGTSPGFQVVGTASNEGEAKLWLDDNQDAWDLAVVDLILDVGNGMGVIKHALALPRPGRVVVFSGYASEGIKQHCLQLGAEVVFDKARTPEFLTWLKDLAARDEGSTR